jgi:hypothetical protein
LNFPFHDNFWRRRYGDLKSHSAALPAGLLHWHFLSWDCRRHRDPRLCAFSRRARPTFRGLGSLPSNLKTDDSTRESPDPEKWALLGAKKRADVGPGVLYNPSLGSHGVPDSSGYFIIIEHLSAAKPECDFRSTWRRRRKFSRRGN